jgi:adenylate cyclase
MVGGLPKYTGLEVAEKAGVSIDFLAAMRRAVGLPVPDPNERAFTDLDVEGAERARQFRDAGLPPEDMIAIARILGRGFSQAAEAMRALVLKLVLEPGASEHDLALRYAELVGRLMPLTEPMLPQMLNLHLRHIARTETISAAERTSGRLPGAREVTIAFADLVGFTRLGEELPADELGRVAARLDELTVEVVEAPVRMIKTIGDAAMLASPEPEPLLDVALALVEAADAEGEEFPQLRAGVASGAAVSRAGDWYGQPVNLASRVTGVARPGSVLATREVRELVRAAAGERFAWSFAGPKRLKGVRDPVSLYRARWAVESDDELDPSRG